MKWIAVIAIFFGSMQVFGQKGYAKDSLQFKAYVHLIYVEARIKEIKVKKVFCDYCSENQLKYLKQNFWNMANSEKYNADVRLAKGLRKRTLLTRIAKEDFQNLKNE